MIVLFSWMAICLCHRHSAVSMGITLLLASLRINTYSLVLAAFLLKLPPR